MGNEACLVMDLATFRSWELIIEDCNVMSYPSSSPFPFARSLVLVLSLLFLLEVPKKWLVE